MPTTGPGPDQADHDLRLLQETAQPEGCQRATRWRVALVRSGSWRSRVTRGGEVDGGLLSVEYDRVTAVSDTAQVGSVTPGALEMRGDE
jgi:hypothetical protein